MRPDLVSEKKDFIAGSIQGCDIVGAFGDPPPDRSARLQIADRRDENVVDHVVTFIAGQQAEGVVRAGGGLDQSILIRRDGNAWIYTRTEDGRVVIAIRILAEMVQPHPALEEEAACVFASFHLPRPVIGEAVVR
jgi:hypothetical protein